MDHLLLAELRRQNRLLKGALAITAVGMTAALTIAAKAPDQKAAFTEIDVERINVRNADGGLGLVISNRERLPKPVTDGKELDSNRDMPGLIFYGRNGDEVGGLIFDAKTGADGKPAGGTHLSMDRLGGDQQIALGHYERNGTLETGLQIYDRGLWKDYGPLWEAYEKAPSGPEKQALLKKWKEAGGKQTQRMFVGRTTGNSSAVVLADAQGRPRILMMVTPDGKPSLSFLDDKGGVLQTLPQQAAAR